MTSQDSSDYYDDSHALSVFRDHPDPKELLTSQEILDNILPMDGANDIIGIVHSVKKPFDVKDKNGKEYTLFKFSLICRDGIEVEVTAWDDDIKRIFPFIKTNHIIYLDALFARSQNPKYSKDKKNWIFTVRSNTVVNTLGIDRKDEEVNTEEIVGQFSDFQDCHKASGVIAYLKSNGILKDNMDSTKGTCLITDGNSELNVLIKQYEGSQIFEQGQKIIFKGEVNASQTSFYVQNVSDIQAVEGEKMSQNTLRKINKFPKRPSTNVAEDMDKKIARMD